MNVSPSPPLPRPFRLLLGIKESLHNVWSQYKYWKPPKYVLSLTVMSESRSIGICQICSECEGTVVQGLRCVGWCRDITLLQSSQKPEKMCLISSRVAAKFCATSLTNVQSWESTGADGLLGLSVSDVWVERGHQAGEIMQLLGTALRAGQASFMNPRHCSSPW